MAEREPNILIVSNPGDRAEIVNVLMDAGYRDLTVGDGDAETLVSFERDHPELVIICANLDRGDAHSLAASMRAGIPESLLRLILIGETDGPIRNALDASDFAVDSFLARPLSAKALLFAVRTCLQEVEQRADASGDEAALKAARQAAAAAMARAEAALGQGAAGADSAAAEKISAVLQAASVAQDARQTAPTIELARKVERAMNRAIDDFVRDAMEALPQARSRSERSPLPVVEAEVVQPAGSDSVGPTPVADALSQDADVQSGDLPRIAMPSHARAAESSAHGSVSQDAPAPGETSRSSEMPGSMSTGADEPTAPDAPPVWPGDTSSRAELDADSRAPDIQGLSESGQEPDDELPAWRQPTVILPDTVMSASAPTAESWTVPLPGLSIDDVIAEPGASEAPSESPGSSASSGSPIAAMPTPQPTPGLAVEQPTNRFTPSAVVGPGVQSGRADSASASARASSAGPTGNEAASVEAAAGPTDTEAVGTQAADAEQSEPSSREFTRELQRKMSVMAERLFPGQVPKKSISSELAHGHATEIDLAALEAVSSEVGDVGEEDDAAVLAGLASVSTASSAASELDAVPAAAGGLTESGTGVPVEPSGAGDSAAARVGDQRPSTRSGSGPDLASPSDVREICRGENDAALLTERMFRQRFTGRIEFYRDGMQKDILFDSGRPVFATSSLAEDRMGEQLFREGKITSEQHRQVRELVAKSGRRMGEVLIEAGWLKRRELLPVVRRHIEDVLYSLFAWDSGQYRIVEGDFAAAERIRISRHPAAMILEGVRRKYNRDSLTALVGSRDTVIEITDDRQLKTVMSVADLTAAERKAIASFDGERSLADIHAASSLELVEVYQLAYGLIVWNAAQPLRRGEVSAARAPDQPTLVGATDLAIDRQRVLAKYSLVEESDYFTLLGVRRDATSFEIRRAYEAARRDYASEGFPPEVRRELGLQISEINDLLEEAYQVLRDDALRSAYLANLRG
ncbi:MAG: DUF4388 domain-containing protein [Proteobacteria bacterium]|nr:DUF4388 domain-containing protein [Pseudomonadota bacterium]